MHEKRPGWGRSVCGGRFGCFRQPHAKCLVPNKNGREEGDDPVWAHNCGKVRTSVAEQAEEEGMEGLQRRRDGMTSERTGMKGAGTDCCASPAWLPNTCAALRGGCTPRKLRKVVRSLLVGQKERWREGDWDSRQEGKRGRRARRGKTISQWTARGGVQRLAERVEQLGCSLPAGSGYVSRKEQQWK